MHVVAAEACPAATTLLISDMNHLHFDTCVAFALHKKDIQAATLEEAGLRVYHRYDFNPQAIFAAVGKGGIVMPIISARFFTTDAEGLVYSVITMVNKATQRITLFNPLTQSVQEYPLQEFLDQWVADGSDCVTAFHVEETTYHPAPIDLSVVQLSEDLKKLGEELAENAHEVWAMERQSEGWTYGPKRDDHKLQTPDMIPYTQLPDTEKQYDRLMATETIRLLIAKGYKIFKD